MRTLQRVLLSALLFSACSQSEQLKYKLYVDIDSCLKAQKVSIYDLFSRLELVALDDSIPENNNVYSGPAYIAKSEERIYILDERKQTVNVYDLQGSLLMHSNNVGRGPGEYTMGRQIQYNPKLNLVEILNPSGQILRYTPDSLKYVSKLSFSGSPLATHWIAQQENGYYLFSYSDEHQLYYMGLNHAETESLKYSSPDNLRHYMAPYPPILCLDGRPAVFRVNDGLTYSIGDSDSSVKPILRWNFGKYNSRLKDIPQYDDARKYEDFISSYSQDHIAAFGSMIAHKANIFSTVVFRNTIYNLHYNTEAQSYHFFERTKEDMSFLPELFVDGVMYKYIDAQFLPKYVNREILDPDSRAAYDEILESGGSGVIKYYLD